METERIEPDGAVVRLSKNELLILNNSLNEVCNALDTPEFSTRIGAQLENVEQLLSQISFTYDTLEDMSRHEALSPPVPGKTYLDNLR